MSSKLDVEDTTAGESNIDQNDGSDTLVEEEMLMKLLSCN
jgi:hypothetical protein